MEEILLVGGGGHCRSCIDVIEMENKYRIAGIIEIKEMNRSVLGYPIIGTDNNLQELVKQYQNFFIAIGQIESANVRIEKFEYLKKLGASFPVIISPLAHVSKHSALGEGTIIMHNVVVNAGVQIGKNCIINTGSIIEHDVVVGNYCHIAPGAVVNGGTKIGAKTFLGSNSATRQNIEIGEGAFVKSGVTLSVNIGPNEIFPEKKKVPKKA